MSVVSDNIWAVAPTADLATRVETFVDRMHEMFTAAQVGAPDVVLVQEVRKSSAAKVRNELTSKFGCTYAIPPNANALKAGFKWKKKFTHLLIQDTAVIVNTDSMSIAASGQVTNGYAYKHAAVKKGKRSVNIRRAAWAKVIEKGDPSVDVKKPLKVAVASVHLARTNNFKTVALSESYKAKHVGRIANALQTTLPDPDRDGEQSNPIVHVIGGDFNQNRYSQTTPTKVESPAYSKLTNSPYKYIDGVLTLDNPSGNPIDYLFSTGNFMAASDDETHTGVETHPTFYSQHAIRWGLIEGEDKTPPTAPGNITNGFNRHTDHVAVLKAWDESVDGGTGFGYFEIFRKELPGGTLESAGQALEDEFLDPHTGLVDGTTYEYSVRACDLAPTPNCSALGDPFILEVNIQP